MHCNNWIFDMDGTLTDSMTVVWEGAPDALLARYGRTPKSDLHKTLLTMGHAHGRYRSNNTPRALIDWMYLALLYSLQAAGAIPQAR